MQNSDLEKLVDIIFYDGDCGMCNRFINFVFWIGASDFHFAPLQGKNAKIILSDKEISDLSTIVVINSDGVKLYKSDAVIYIISKSSSWLSRIAFVMRFFPKIIRDFVYDIVAKYRKFLFGSYDVCQFLSNKELDRFLD